MSIYISKNNQQTGPFDESRVLEMLASGQLSPNDFAIRQGATQWLTIVDKTAKGVVQRRTLAVRFVPFTRSR